MRRALLAALAVVCLLGPACAQFTRPLGRPVFQFLNGSLFSLDFTQGVLPPGVSATGATNGSRLNAAGVLVSATSPRFDYLGSTLASLGILNEAAGTNNVRNSTMQGASAGTPGTLPTNWSILNSANNLSTEVVGTGTEDGVPYLDFHVFGTTTAAGGLNLYVETATGISATDGQAVTTSFYHKLVGGTTNCLTSVIRHSENTSGGTLVVGANGAIGQPTGAGLATQRVQNTRTLSGGGTVAAYQPAYRFNNTASCVADETVRIGLPQVDFAALAQSSVPTSGSTASHTADAISFTIPSGVSQITYVFDNNANQIVSVSPGAYSVPTNLNRTKIKTITGQ